MVRKSFMLIAGETSGDQLAAELARALRELTPPAESGYTDETQPLSATLAPELFGAGGPGMAAAGVELEVDLTRYAAVGPADALRHYLALRRVLQRLLELAFSREPDAIILVDFSGFNLPFARAARRVLRQRRRLFNNWTPRIVSFVSPQVWASRPGRARGMARTIDLVLSIFPFEKAWYAQHAPDLEVKFVGHPLIDRYAGCPRPAPLHHAFEPSWVVLLPGSRRAELERHVPLMRETARILQKEHPCRFGMILPDAGLEPFLKNRFGHDSLVPVQVGGLPEKLARADLAIASTGTVTLECAYFGVPTVAVYKTAWLTYELGKRLVQVPWLAMPNILAQQTVFPELIQHNATPEKTARKALDLLQNHPARQQIQAVLAKVIESLGPPGATRRAAQAIIDLVHSRPWTPSPERPAPAA